MSDGSKDIILQKIRKALATPTPMPFPEVGTDLHVFKPADNDLAVAFAEQFVSIQGQFSYCISREECMLQLNTLLAAKNWKKIYCADETLRSWLTLDWFSDLDSCDAAITTCEALVVRTGSIMLSAAQPKGRTASVYAPIHICIAYASQLVPDIGDALTLIQQKYPGKPPSLITFASGPSRTADIEKTLVTGVHGPKEVFCFLVEN
jgi:L-lactate dehydrogenase complex protein LldG